MAIIIERIEVTPDVLHGKPHIAGTRVPIDIILGLLGDGLTPEEIIKQHYPHITKDDILACIRSYDINSLQKCHVVLERLLRVESEFKNTLIIVNENKYRKRK